MEGEEGLSVDERRRYLKRMVGRYRKADRAGRGALLSEMEAVTGLHRKSLIRLLNAPTLERQVRRKGRGRTYGSEVAAVVRRVWDSLDYVCAERLTPALWETARHLAKFGELELTPEVEAKLQTISRATVQRLIDGAPRLARPLPRRGPERANQLRQAVPMGRLPWDVDEPGHCETDLVHHAGGSSEGEYAHTLQVVDVLSGWSGRAALLGRSQREMGVAFQNIFGRLPFAVKTLHPDNGSEFFNNHLVRLFGQQMTGLKLMRSRPYHKNDNRIVEQKNYSLVRAYFGRDRLETPDQVAAMNALYLKMDRYYNLFQPVMHLAAKDIVDGKLRRRWDTPATPLQRLVASGALRTEDLAPWLQLYDETNPRQLRQEIYDGIQHLWATPSQRDLRTAAAS
jgi:hypothetical protein